MPTVIKVENVSKQYRLGKVGTGTLSHDLNRWWHSIRGKEDPYLKIGETNDRTVKGSTDYVWALRDINFEITQGEAVGIIGRNGAGKSTLLKILSRTTAPTTGSVKIKGRVASLLEVGTGFHPELTGRDNIYLNGAILGMTRKEITRKFDEIVDFAGVERYIDTPVKRYSSGMHLRLAFAVAAHLESEILIIDEVLAVGDAEFQKKCLGKMGAVSKGEGRTVLFVSHNMGAIKNLCSLAIVLSNGGIVYNGESDTGINYYLGEFQLDEQIERNFVNKNKLPVFIERVELWVNGEKAQSGGLDFRDTFGFRLFLDVCEVVKTRGIIIHCHDAHERLFQAFDISVLPELFEGRPIGKHIVDVEFPLSFFREGMYSFHFEIGHFGVGAEQREENAISIAVRVLSRNPRFEAATSNRPNKVYIEPTWRYSPPLNA
jgi:lipopolysaccharide transport system ATP-binding protein